MTARALEISPCGTMIEFPIGARALTFERFGVVKETARADTLLIDLDLPGGIWRRRILPLRVVRGVLPIRVIRAVCSIVGVHPICVRYDRSRRGFHVAITLRERMPRAEIVALQACLGSDSRREALNLMRARAIRLYGAPRAFRSRWNLLFARKLQQKGAAS